MNNIKFSYQFQAQLWTKVDFKIHQYYFDLVSCKGRCIKLKIFSNKTVHLKSKLTEDVVKAQKSHLLIRYPISLVSPNVKRRFGIKKQIMPQLLSLHIALVIRHK
jgi:hypothetical protein